MGDYEQRLRRRRDWEREAAAALAKANEHLRRRLHQSERQCRALEAANANLRVERDAADVLLGEAMDQLGSRSP
jgi:predicted RNase H-like nuclease (RuvC/YqgF family)